MSQSGETMTPDLAELERLLAAATKGEWKLWNGYSCAKPSVLAACERIGPDGDGSWSDEEHDWNEPGLCSGHDGSDIVGVRADFELIVAAVNALPALVEELKRLRAVAEAAREYRNTGPEFWKDDVDKRRDQISKGEALDAALAGPGEPR